MTAPAVEAGRFLMACGVGAGLGLFYGFLRPLRPRMTHLSDLVFVVAAFWGWLFVGFGICGGDLHFGHAAGMLLGGLLWEFTLGRLLRPVFSVFWKVLGWPFEKICYFFRKIIKNYLHS